MIVDNDKLSFMLNEVNLGMCFTDKRMAESILYPVVYINSTPDEVQILNGFTRSEQRVEKIVQKNPKTGTKTILSPKV